MLKLEYFSKSYWWFSKFKKKYVICDDLSLPLTLWVLFMNLTHALDWSLLVYILTGMEDWNGVKKTLQELNVVAKKNVADQESMKDNPPNVVHKTLLSTYFTVRFYRGGWFFVKWIFSGTSKKVHNFSKKMRRKIQKHHWIHLSLTSSLQF